MNRIFFYLAIFIVSACWAGDENQEREAKFAEFKHKLMPHAGKEFSASGHFDAGKFGWWLGFDGWGVYIETRGTNSLAPLNALNRYRGKEVTVKGILYHQPELRSENPIAAGIPEHFFFDAGECKVSEKSEPKQDAKPQKPPSDFSTNAHP